MNLLRLVKSSLFYYWRTNVGVLLGAMVSSAVLVGALLVGDSVDHTLGSLVDERLGRVEVAAVTGDRFFRSELAGEAAEVLGCDGAGVLTLWGMSANDDGSKRANRVQILGVDAGFYRLGGAAMEPSKWGDEIVINDRLAEALGVQAGGEILVRVSKPGAMPMDVVLSTTDNMTAASRMRVRGVAGVEQFGRFGLEANQVGAMTVFVPIARLQEMVGQAGMANMVLFGGGVQSADAERAVDANLRLADVGLLMRQLEDQGQIEVRSRRVFIDKFLEDAVVGADENAESVLTYFVNELRCGERGTPYSLVTAIDAFEGLGDGEIVINEWLADDLGAGVGSEVKLAYFVAGPKRKLVEERRSFRVKSVVKIEGLAGDRELMPDFPGLSDEENCRDWDPGIDVDLDRIRERDEDYWDEYRGTPKAFVSLKAGRAMWDNRFGSLTAVRYADHRGKAEDFERKILAKIDGRAAGFNFMPVRAMGEMAGAEGTDFGQLFAGLSMFLIASAVLLTRLLFVFGVERRRTQSGLLLGVGVERRIVSRILMVEGGVLSLVGSTIGGALGVVYTKVMILCLSTVWSGAAGSAIRFGMRPVSIVVGGGVGFVVSLFAIWLSVCKQMKQRPVELLRGTGEDADGTVRGGKGRVTLCIGAAALIGALWLVVFAGEGTGAGVFFGAGALLLFGSIMLVKWTFGRRTRKKFGQFGTLFSLAMRNMVRRSGRSVAVISLFGCGCFMVLAVGANRKDIISEAHDRDSGTGGFALFAESTIGIYDDLNIDERFDGANFVQCRVGSGDDASCLNLNRVQVPRLFGVDPSELIGRGAFSFAATIKGGDGWEMLNMDCGDGVIAGVADNGTIMWGLGKKVGDTIDYVDERGRAFKVRLVGGLKNSILQGSIIVAEEKFAERYPSEAGYKVLLVDCEQDRADAVRDRLNNVFVDSGMDVVNTVERLRVFNEVESTYLMIFQLLGGFGLVLGSVGLGLVVLVNVLDRRGELAMMRAVGYSRSRLRQMIVYEHVVLLCIGLLCGICCAFIAVFPAVKSPGADVPFWSLIVTIACILFSGVLWVYVAAGSAMRGELLGSLRNE